MLVNPEEILSNRYKSPTRATQFPRLDTLYPFGDKLGEIIMLSSIPSKSKAENVEAYLGINQENKFLSFTDYIVDYVKPPDGKPVLSFQSIVENHCCGNGNLTQQVYRVLGLKHEVVPKGNLNMQNPVKRNKIGIHVDGIGAGSISYDLEARTLNHESKLVIQDFINSFREYDFHQYGKFDRPDIHVFENCNARTDLSLTETVRDIASCDYFICINSAFYHAAISFGCKTICLINRPHISFCYLPILRWNNFHSVVPTTYDHNWLYPQAVHLHEDGENELVKRITGDNLRRAINGEIYPFWETKYCELTKIWET